MKNEEIPILPGLQMQLEGLYEMAQAEAKIEGLTKNEYFAKYPSMKKEIEELEKDIKDIQRNGEK